MIKLAQAGFGLLNFGLLAAGGFALLATGHDWPAYVTAAWAIVQCVGIGINLMADVPTA